MWLAGCSPNPTGAWVSQQARNLGLDLDDQGVRVLIRDRDSTYTATFNQVLRSGGIRVAKTPVRAPQANAIAERFVRPVRAECLDWLPIVNRRHLDRVPRVYEQYLKVGLLDEMQIHLVPVLLGDGVRLFDHLSAQQTKLDKTRAIETPSATHLRLKVRK